MNNTTIQGRVSFVNHEKKYAIIEYEENGKKKTINTNIDEQWQKNLIKKVHRYHIGDTVRFIIARSDRKDRVIATNVEYQYNDALEVLLNKSKKENKFTGYLKIVDDQYFVKEIESYLFFPVPFSAWQIKPTESTLNESVLFSLEDTEKKDKITAKLLNNKYIPGFYTAVQCFKEKKAIVATIYKITPHGIYLELFDNQIQAKLPLSNGPLNKDEKIQMGDRINVVITYISSSRIVVEESGQPGLE